MSSKSSKKPRKKKREYTPEQREAQKARNRRRYASLTPEQRDARRKQQNSARARTHRRYELKRHYGITPTDYDLMLQSQGHRCAICGSKKAGREGSSHFCVDHNHSTGKVRGLLCHACNIGLGKFKDSPLTLSKAITYLEDRDG